MRPARSRGVTLLEALLTMFLFSVALAVVSQLIAGSQQMIRHSAGRSQALRSSQWALANLRHQIEASASIDQPASGSSSTLRLNVFKKELSNRLPETLPSRWRPSRDPFWDPYDPRYLETVEYEVKSEQLIQTVGVAELMMIENVAGFSVDNLGRQLQIELVLEEETKTTRFVSRVKIP